MTDDVPSFTLEAVEWDTKIGRNPIKSGYRPWKYVTVRHVPIARDSFAYYGEDLLPDFNALPNWKYATPHTIQRITPQNESCNACHGNTELFLTSEDVPSDELRANWPVIVERVIGEIR
jgi:thiosulfate/3-mercaptopyruvate sulfurtransferase